MPTRSRDFGQLKVRALGQVRGRRRWTEVCRPCVSLRSVRLSSGRSRDGLASDAAVIFVARPRVPSARTSSRACCCATRSTSTRCARTCSTSFTTPSAPRTPASGCGSEREVGRNAFRTPLRYTAAAPVPKKGRPRWRCAVIFKSVASMNGVVSVAYGIVGLVVPAALASVYGVEITDRGASSCDPSARPTSASACSAGWLVASATVRHAAPSPSARWRVGA